MALGGSGEGGGVYEYLEEIFGLVEDGLKSGGKSGSGRVRPCVSEALYCAADLVEALGPKAEPYIPKLVDEMFDAGLSQQLIYALQGISSCSPKHQHQIHDRLLQELSVCLAGTSNAFKVAEDAVIRGIKSVTRGGGLTPKPAKMKKTR